MIRTVTRHFRFEAAHRLLNHKGRCAWIHGHSYVATVVLQGRGLDDQGMLVDFSKLKDTIGKWIDDHWDHNIILNPADPLIEANSHVTIFGREPYIIAGKNPTAENMAECLAAIILDICKTELSVFAGRYLKSVTIRETESCSATIENTDIPTNATDMRHL